MRIGELAKAAGVRIDTLRHYERIGLLKAPLRTEAGYRQYGAEDLERMQFIRRGRDLGFTLSELAALLSIEGAAAGTAADVLALTRAKIAALQTRLADLARIEAALDGLANDCPVEAPVSDCPIFNHLKGASLVKAGRPARGVRPNLGDERWT
jgi:DNA-binding transcriptional MerR regulator